MTLQPQVDQPLHSHVRLNAKGLTGVWTVDWAGFPGFGAAWLQHDGMATQFYQNWGVVHESVIHS